MISIFGDLLLQALSNEVLARIDFADLIYLLQNDGLSSACIGESSG